MSSLSCALRIIIHTVRPRILFNNQSAALLIVSEWVKVNSGPSRFRNTHAKSVEQESGRDKNLWFVTTITDDHIERKTVIYRTLYTLPPALLNLWISELLKEPV